MPDADRELGDGLDDVDRGAGHEVGGVDRSAGLEDLPLHRHHAQEADRRQVLRVVGVERPGRHRGDDPDLAQLAVALDAERRGLRAVAPDRLADLLPVTDRLAVEGDEAVTRLQLGLARRCGVVAQLLGRARPSVLVGGDDAGDHLVDHRSGLDPVDVADRAEDAPEEEERDEQVDRGAPGHHDHLLPPGHLVEEPVLVADLDVLPLGRAGVGDQLGEDAGVGLADPHHAVALVVVDRVVAVLVEVLGTRRQHPDDLDVAAERDRLDAVLGLADLLAPHRRPEADEPLGDLPAEHLGGDHVTELVEPDRGQDGDEEDHHAQRVVDGGHASPSIRVTAAARAQASAPSTSSTVSPPSEGTSWVASTAPTVETMSTNLNRPARNASTHTSLAAL